MTPFSSQACRISKISSLSSLSPGFNSQSCFILVSLPSLNISIDSQGRPITTQTMRNDGERLLLEQNLISSCMNATGHYLHIKDPP